ncbi:hypothetical protein EDB87DRAFT_1588912 [Lactarius vividus]|nr:hypothetical protein EDB87DRAFT_1588912 [Lactarius vividus]
MGYFDLVAPSPISLGNGKLHSGDGELIVPRELAVAEVEEYVQLHSKAANNAGEADFDGMEVHAINAHLHDQFSQTVSMNGRMKRQLVWKGRSFALAPCSDSSFRDLLPTFTTFIERVRDAHSNFAYTHAIESH